MLIVLKYSDQAVCFVRVGFFIWMSSGLAWRGRQLVFHCEKSCESITSPWNEYKVKEKPVHYYMSSKWYLSFSVACSTWLGGMGETVESWKWLSPTSRLKTLFSPIDKCRSWIKGRTWINVLEWWLDWGLLILSLMVTGSYIKPFLVMSHVAVVLPDPTLGLYIHVIIRYISIIISYLASLMYYFSF